MKHLWTACHFPPQINQLDPASNESWQNDNRAVVEYQHANHEDEAVLAADDPGDFLSLYHDLPDPDDLIEGVTIQIPENPPAPATATSLIPLPPTATRKSSTSGKRKSRIPVKQAPLWPQSIHPHFFSSLLPTATPVHFLLFLCPSKNIMRHGWVFHGRKMEDGSFSFFLWGSFTMAYQCISAKHILIKNMEKKYL